MEERNRYSEIRYYANLLITYPFYVEYDMAKL